MAFSSTLSLLLVLILTSCSLSQCSIFEEGTLSLARWARKLQDNTCGPVDCVHGECSVVSSFPFYRCECTNGWQSPLNESWIPCILPNCSLNLGCSGNASLIAPSPAVSTTDNLFSICALPVCGDGECVSSSNTSRSYECNCNSGSTNLFNVSDGYCLPECALGAGCANLNTTVGGSPTNLSPGLNLYQGTRQLYTSALIICGVLLLRIGW